MTIEDIFILLSKSDHRTIYYDAPKGAKYLRVHILANYNGDNIVSTPLSYMVKKETDKVYYSTTVLGDRVHLVFGLKDNKVSVRYYYRDHNEYISNRRSSIINKLINEKY